ncbi:MAG: hypothetical protein ACRED5_16415 [Propylenella sp.]
MFCTLYAICVVALLAGTAWTAASADLTRARTNAGLGLVILTALQR